MIFAPTLAYSNLAFIKAYSISSVLSFYILNLAFLIFGE